CLACGGPTGLDKGADRQVAHDQVRPHSTHLACCASVTIYTCAMTSTATTATSSSARCADDVASPAHSVTGAATLDNTALRRYLHGLPGVDQVGADARAAMLGTRSIKTTAKAWAIDTVISMIDLTTLEGADTPGKVRS